MFAETDGRRNRNRVRWNGRGSAWHAEDGGGFERAPGRYEEARAGTGGPPDAAPGRSQLSGSERSWRGRARSRAW